MKIYVFQSVVISFSILFFIVHVESMNSQEIPLRNQKGATRPELPIIMNWLRKILNENQVRTLVNGLYQGSDKHPLTLGPYINKNGRLKTILLLQKLEDTFEDRLAVQLRDYASHQGILTQAPKEIRDLLDTIKTGVEEVESLKEVEIDREKRGAEIRDAWQKKRRRCYTVNSKCG